VSFSAIKGSGLPLKVETMKIGEAVFATFNLKRLGALGEAVSATPILSFTGL